MRARKPCQTGAMEKNQQTSVNQLVWECLTGLVKDPSRRRLARARLKKAFETGLVHVGDRKWSRDDLYHR